MYMMRFCDSHAGGALQDAALLPFQAACLEDRLQTLPLQLAAKFEHASVFWQQTE